MCGIEEGISSVSVSLTCDRGTNSPHPVEMIANVADDMFGIGDDSIKCKFSVTGEWTAKVEVGSDSRGMYTV
jgi:hypothetical protein